MKYALFCLFLASPALAQEQPQCAPFADIADGLMTNFGESLRTMAVTGGEVAMVAQTYVNDATGTWTLIVVRPDGVGCLMASGVGFEFFDAIPAGDPA